MKQGKYQGIWLLVSIIYYFYNEISQSQQNETSNTQGREA